jgi:DNA gyrase/topoisomerase IV subunit A
MIYGNEEQQEWTQVLAYGNVKNKFYNPIKQNNSHIYKLQKFLPKNIDIISIVVFIDANIENVDSNNVCNLDELDEILHINYGKTISPKQIDYVANILRRYQNNNITDEEHINNIHKMQEDIENNICPRCGAKLVLRDSEYGMFLGCSKYPKCKFKKNL